MLVLYPWLHQRRGDSWCTNPFLPLACCCMIAVVLGFHLEITCFEPLGGSEAADWETLASVYLPYISTDIMFEGSNKRSYFPNFRPCFFKGCFMSFLIRGALWSPLRRWWYHCFICKTLRCGYNWLPSLHRSEGSTRWRSGRQWPAPRGKIAPQSLFWTAKKAGSNQKDPERPGWDTLDIPWYSCWYPLRLSQI